MLLHFDPHYREGIQMLVLCYEFRPGKAAAQLLFYYIRPHWTGCQGRGSKCYFFVISLGLERLLRSYYSIISGSTGQDARGGDPNAISSQKINPGKAAVQQLFYYIWPPLDRVLRRGADPNASSLQKKIQAGLLWKDIKNMQWGIRGKTKGDFIFIIRKVLKTKK